MAEEKYKLTVVSIVVASIVLCLGMLFVWSYSCNKKYIEAGFSRRMLPGSSVSHWTK